MSSAVVQLRWAIPEGVPDVADLQQLPRCSRTRRNLVDHAEEAIRHFRHRRFESNKKRHLARRGKELTTTQNRVLFSDGASPDDFKGYKLTSRQRAQLKVLRKQRVRALRLSVETQVTVA